MKTKTFDQFLSLKEGDRVEILGFAEKGDSLGFNQVITVNGSTARMTDGTAAPLFEKFDSPIKYVCKLKLVEQG